MPSYSKKTIRAVLPYLDKAEIDALLASPDCQTAQGRRDHALLLFLYNSGARADEAAHVTIADLDLTPPASVRILGKGNKERCCPLWPATARELTELVAYRGPRERVFLNRCGQPITRSASTRWSNVVCSRPGAGCHHCQPNESAPIRSAIPPQCTFCGRAWASTQSVHGLDTCRSIPPTCMQRSI